MSGPRDIFIIDDNDHNNDEGGGGSSNNAASKMMEPEQVIKFIRRVKSLPILYDQDHEHFRNSGKKQDAWKQIGEEFNQNERWCLRKWVSLRDYFVKRKKRLRLGKPLKPWLYYNELSFLNKIYGEDDEDVNSSISYYANNTNSNSMDNTTGSSNGYHQPFYDESEGHDQYEDDDEVGDEGEEYANPVKLELVDDIDDEEFDEVVGPSSSSSSSVGQKSKSILLDRSSTTTNASSSSNQQNGVGVVLRPGTRRSANEFSSNSNNDPLSKRVKLIGPKRSVRVDNVGYDDDREEEPGYLRRTAQQEHSRGSSCNQPHFSVSDPHDLFCMSVAAQLKSMPKEKAMRVQIDIMNLMYKSQFIDDNRK